MTPPPATDFLPTSSTAWRFLSRSLCNIAIAIVCLSGSSASGTPAAESAIRTHGEILQEWTDTFAIGIALNANLCAPGIANPSVTGITEQTATLNAELVSDGNSPLSAKGFVYSLTAENADPQLNGLGVQQINFIIEPPPLGPFGAQAGPLSPGTSYTFKAFARNEAGLLAYSAAVAFTTHAATPNLSVEDDPGMAIGEVIGWGYPTPPRGLTNVVAIASGYAHSLGLRADGTVVAWGYNPHGAINVPEGLTTVTAVAAGDAHSMALRQDGTVVAWGSNQYGQCNIPAGLTTVKAIASGSGHSLALKSDGTVVTWGLNEDGQATVPANLTNVVAIAAGVSHSLALKQDGSVVGWGKNIDGQANSFASAVAIAAAGDYSMAITTEGTVSAWGASYYGAANIPRELTDVTAIATGARHALARRQDGSVVGWGDDSTASGGNFNFPPGLSGVTAISAGGNQSVALTGPPAVSFGRYSPNTQGPARSITLRSVGLAPLFLSSVTLSGPHAADFTLAPQGVPTGAPEEVTDTQLTITFAPSALGKRTATLRILTNDPDTPIFEIALSGEGVMPVSHIKVLTTPTSPPNHVVGWGRSDYNQLNIPEDLTNVLSVAAGETHALALKADGTVVCWGTDFSGETIPPLGLTGVKSIGAGRHFSVALQTDGTVVAWGVNDHGQTNVPANLSEVAFIDVSDLGVIAIKGDGTVVTWGYFYQPPQGLSSFSGMKGASVGQRQTSLVTEAGSIITFGWNTGDYVAYPRLRNVSALTSGGVHNVALLADGSVHCWLDDGSNGTPECMVPNGLDNVTSVAAARGYSMALKADGSLVVWGHLSGFPPTVPMTDKVQTFAAGDGYALAVVEAPSATAIDFPFYVPGAPIASKTLYISNRGPGALAITSFEFTGPDADSFSMDTTDMLTPVPALTGSTSCRVQFTPIHGGYKQATLRIHSSAQNAPVVELALAGTSFQLTLGEIAYNQWAAAAGLTGADAAQDAIPFGDGVPNLLKYAFNLDGAGPDATILPPANGTSGLPRITLDTSQFPYVWKFEYLYRRNAGLACWPELSSLMNGEDMWQPILDSPTITPINDNWDRAVFQIPFDSLSSTGFARIRVTLQ